METLEARGKCRLWLASAFLIASTILFVDALLYVHRHILSNPTPQSQGQTVTYPLSSGSVTFALPSNFSVNEKELSVGGPIEFDDFGHAYYNGGIIPENGAEMGIFEEPLRSSLGDLISEESYDTAITSTTTIIVGGLQGEEVLRTDQNEPTFTLKDVDVYIPNGLGLYKIYLSYREGDPAEAQLLSDFQGLLSSIRF